MQSQFRFDGEATVEKSQGTNKSSERSAVGQEVRFCCEGHQESFQRLTKRQQEYITHYMTTGSPTEIAKAMRLTGSTRTINKTLGEIARRMGLKSIRELKPNTHKTTSATSNATAKQLKQTLEDQEYRCALSGVELSIESAELDHKTPLSAGGTNAAENLQWLDGVVNRAKGTMSQESFIRMCVRVAEWNR